MLQSPGSIAFSIGSLEVRWYGILIAAGILLCYWYVTAEVKRRKLGLKPIDDMALWIIIAGVIGARLYYVLFNLEYFSAHSLEILQIWKGGLAIHGALIGGAAAYFIFVALKKIPPLLYADAIMPGILLAQAIGRFGNFFNNEAFGRPTDLPWKLFIPESARPLNYEDFDFFHPTFLYESLWNLLGFALLVWLSRKIYPRDSHSRTSGIILFAYLTFYSIGRFMIESLRTDSLMLGSFRVAQLVSIALFLIGIFGLIFVARRGKIKLTP